MPILQRYRENGYTAEREQAGYFKKVEGVDLDEYGCTLFSCFEGHIVSTYERNGYDDSDFYAVVFYPAVDGAEPELFEVEYATTRFAGGGHAIVDASEELRQQWLAYCREKQAAEKAAKRQAAIEALVEKRLPVELASVFVDRSANWRSDIRSELEKLLCTRKFRSAFRQSLCNQLVEWLQNPSPEYSFPLSDRQLASLLRF